MDLTSALRRWSEKKTGAGRFHCFSFASLCPNQDLSSAAVKPRQKRPCAYQSIDLRPIAAEVSLGVDHQSSSSSQTLLQQRIPGRQRHAVVTTLYHDVDAREQALHLGQASTMMAEEVGPRNRIVGREGRSWHEPRHNGRDLVRKPSGGGLGQWGEVGHQRGDDDGGTCDCAKGLGRRQASLLC